MKKKAVKDVSKNQTVPKRRANENIYQTSDRLKLQYPELKDYLIGIEKEIRIVERTVCSQGKTKEERDQLYLYEMELYEKIEEIDRREIIERFKRKIEMEGLPLKKS